MYDRTDEAYGTARDLITSRNFEDRYVFDAYIVMLRSHPESWSLDLSLARKRISRLNRDIGSGSDVQLQVRLRTLQDTIAATIHRDVAISLLSAGLRNLEVAPSEDSDAWLVDRLFLGERPYFQLQSDLSANRSLLIDKRDEARMCDVLIDNRLGRLLLYLNQYGRRSEGSLRANIRLIVSVTMERIRSVDESQPEDGASELVGV